MCKSNNKTTINKTIESLNKRIDEIEGRKIILFNTKESKLKNYIEKEWTRKIHNSSKSDSCKLFKLNPIMEKYLKDIKDITYKNFNKI